MRKLTSKQKKLLKQEYDRMVASGIEYPEYWDVDYRNVLLPIDNLNPCENFSQNVEQFFSDMNSEKRQEIGMKVTLDFETFTCRVTKTAGDPRFTNSNWSDDESVFLYHVKQELIKMGYDVIKKRMWKDGHMVDERRQYVRSRVLDDNSFCVFNDRYDFVSAGKEFNELGEFDLYLQPL